MTFKTDFTWQEIKGNWIVLPKSPRGIIHFLGGAFIGATPQITYRALLEGLGQGGYVVIATPFINTFDHLSIAQAVLRNFEATLAHLYHTILSSRNLPLYGLGHSMGSKLHLLLGSAFSIQRSGNIFLAFNNYPAYQSIPFWQQVAPAMDLDREFKPAPEQVWNLATQSYRICRNLVVQFQRDELDETPTLIKVLHQCFHDRSQPNAIVLNHLSGNHLTPLAQDPVWETGAEFSPLDALGQWVKQQAYRDFHQLQQEILTWLNAQT
jgi:hypothetical protein